MNSHHPPKLPLRFFRWFCHPDYREDIEGDLLERFEDKLEKGGQLAASVWLAFEVIKLVRPGLVRGIGGNYTYSSFSMLKNYFLTTFRSAKKEKTFAFLSVFGLSIGFTACLYIAMYAIEELSYDTFHEKADRIYRINQTFIWGKDVARLFDSTGPGVMPAIQAEVPEFEVMTRIHTVENTLVAAQNGGDEKVFEEELIRSADSTFFDVFTFPLVKGNPKSALVNPYSVVLTEETAQKYFGTTDVLGKQLMIGEKGSEDIYQVTGVAANIPSNSFIKFRLLTSISSLERLGRPGQANSWWWTTFVVFGVIRPDADIQAVADKVASVPAKYLVSFLPKARGISYEEFIASGETWDLYIQPLLDAHLRSDHVISRLADEESIQTIYVLLLIAGLTLLLSVINFVNLMTARSSRRAKEVGVRKVLGSRRESLIGQFMIESCLFCLLALILSIGFVALLMPYFNSVSGKEIPFRLTGDPLIASLALAITLLTGILAGVYPAFYLSSFKPGQVLKGKLVAGSRKSRVRNLLVTLQFSVSLGLIICAIVIQQEVDHMVRLEMGFDKENKLIIQGGERLQTKLEGFREEISTIASVGDVSISTDTPPWVDDSDNGFYADGNKENTHDVSFWVTDQHFAEVYKLSFLAGRNFDDNLNDGNATIITRKLSQALGFADPAEAVGRRLVYKEEGEFRIIGVIEDINTGIWGWGRNSLPALFHLDGFPAPRSNRELSISFRQEMTGEQVREVIENIEEKWDEFTPNTPFKYTFFDIEYAKAFEGTTRFGQLVGLYSVLAMIIAGLGLTGLVGYVIDRRNKEIGVRKVLGASVKDIVGLITGEFGALLSAGFVIGSFAAWYLMRQWLDGFPERTPLTAWPFVLAGAVMLLVAIATIWTQTIRAARNNPVKYLRDE